MRFKLHEESSAHFENVHYFFIVMTRRHLPSFITKGLEKKKKKATCTLVSTRRTRRAQKEAKHYSWEALNMVIQLGDLVKLILEYCPVFEGRVVCEFKNVKDGFTVDPRTFFLTKEKPPKAPIDFPYFDKLPWVCLGFKDYILWNFATLWRFKKGRVHRLLHIRNLKTIVRRDSQTCIVVTYSGLFVYTLQVYDNESFRPQGPKIYVQAGGCRDTFQWVPHLHKFYMGNGEHHNWVDLKTGAIEAFEGPPLKFEGRVAVSMQGSTIKCLV